MMGVGNDQAVSEDLRVVGAIQPGLINGKTTAVVIEPLKSIVAPVGYNEAPIICR